MSRVKNPTDLINSGMSFSLTRKLSPQINLLLKEIFHRAKHEEVWRYFTYSLLHANGEHIVVNLSLLLFVGFSMELIHGTLRPLLVYVLGVSARI